MAVFTPVSEDHARALLSRYALGGLVSLTPIAQGVENSNFHLLTTGGRYILTLFEGRTDVSSLPFFFDLTRHLQARGVNCPVAVADTSGGIIQQVAGKPAAIITFLTGRGVESSEITVDRCAEVGRLLAQLHLAAGDFTGQRANTVSLAAWGAAVEVCRAGADTVVSGLAEIVDEEMQFLTRAWPGFQSLPRGVIHADLFPDNVFVDDVGAVCGVIDFYFACNDVLIYDLGIVINAWCFDAGHVFVPARARAMMDAYRAVRSLSNAEESAMNVALRAACVRFLTSRLHDWLFSPVGALVTPKDPREYLKKLQYHQRVDR